MATVGEKIKYLRQKRGLSQSELCKILNDQFQTKISKGRLSNWETNKNNPAFLAVQFIADTFNVNINYFRRNAGPLSQYEINNDKLNDLVSGFNRLSKRRQDKIINCLNMQLEEQNK